ncbi:unnamed protein product [Musa acuminata var. zebrina]
MGGPESPPNPNPKRSSLCVECGSNPWKYRCPGCSILTCSLPCVKSHKERTRCTGKRNRTEFVPLSQFDDKLLFSDYDLLEETKRVTESAHRLITGFGSNYRFHLPTRLRMLRNAANRRRTRLLSLPLGMSKRDKNQSRYNQKNNCIYWTVEWRFHSTDVVLFDHGVDEYGSISSVIEKHLAPSPWNNQLRQFCDISLDDLSFFIRKNAKGTKSPYHKLNIRAPIGQQLQNTVIVEYPVIYVFLPSHKYDFEVEKDAKSISRSEEAPVSASGIPSPKGILFREEKFEEGEMPLDTQVMDLKHCRTSQSSHHSQINKDDITSAEEGYHQDRSMQVVATKTLEPFPTEKHQAASAETKDHPTDVIPENLSQDDKFDFQQEIKDAYLDLMGEIDPDDFLCLDGVYSGGNEVVTDNPPYFGDNFLRDEELEEGEIPGY